MTDHKTPASKPQKKTTKPAIVNVEHPGDVYKALFKFQSEKLVLPRNGQGSSNGKQYNYVTLDDLITGIRPLLEKYELVFAQVILKTELITALVHAPTGTKIESELFLGTAANMQDYGSRITYARRYALQALLGLNAEDDVDAHGSTVPPGAPSTTPTSAPVCPVSQETPTPVPQGSVIHVQPTSPENDPKSTEVSKAFVLARTAIETAFSIEALDLIKGQIEKSVRLNEVEKSMLTDMLENRRSLKVFDKIQ